jgi:hypothetical protein
VDPVDPDPDSDPDPQHWFREVCFWKEFLLQDNICQVDRNPLMPLIQTDVYLWYPPPPPPSIPDVLFKCWQRLASRLFPKDQTSSPRYILDTCHKINQLNRIKSRTLYYTLCLMRKGHIFKRVTFFMSSYLASP